MNTKTARPTWDEYFVNMTYLVASRSTDLSTHAGAVIVTEDNSIVSTGYNGPPRGVTFEKNDPRNERPLKYMWMEHAERNAIYNAVRHGICLNNCILYVNFFPCTDCSRAIIQSGINLVKIHKEGHNVFINSQTNNNWEDTFKVSKEILKKKTRWISSKIIKPVGFFSGKEYDL